MNSSPVRRDAFENCDYTRQQKIAISGIRNAWDKWKDGTHIDSLRISGLVPRRVEGPDAT